ncbi:MAG: hypothetical protein R2799_09410 [Crocinitomicaceae bacterium]
MKKTLLFFALITLMTSAFISCDDGDSTPSQTNLFIGSWITFRLAIYSF